MFQGEQSAILLTFITLSFVIKIFVVMSIQKWPFYTVFTGFLFTAFTPPPPTPAPKSDFLSVLRTCPDAVHCMKTCPNGYTLTRDATQTCPVCSCNRGNPTQHTVSGHHGSTSETPFKWRFAGGPMVARFPMLTMIRFGYQ